MVTVVTVTVVIFVTLVIVTVVIVTVVSVAAGTVVIVTYFSKNNLTPRQQMRYSQGSFLRFSLCLYSRSLCPVLLWKDTGPIWCSLVSIVSLSWSLIGTYIDRSSTHFFLLFPIGFLIFLGWVIICPIGSVWGFGPAPLKVTQNRKSPIIVPWPAPELSGSFLDCFDCQRIVNDLPRR